MAPRLITFYSYKGGVGRTQAVANVAVELANQGEGRRVVCLDLDLESPGLHSYFRPADGVPWSDREEGGFLELVEGWEIDPAPPELSERLVRCAHPYLRRGEVRVLLAGGMDDAYPARVAGLDWDRLPRREGSSFLEYLRRSLRALEVDDVLIDSRTGITDVASICTFYLPDLVIVLFALHEQGLSGTLRVAQAIRRRMASEAAHRPRELMLVPSRVEETDGDQVERWLRRARQELAELGHLNGDDRLPYDRRAAFGEQIVVDPDGEFADLLRAYRRLVERINALLGEGPVVEQIAEAVADPGVREARRALERLRAVLLAWRQAVERVDAARTPPAVLVERAREQEELAERAHGAWGALLAALWPLARDWDLQLPEPGGAGTLCGWEDRCGAAELVLGRAIDAVEAQMVSIRDRLGRIPDVDAALLEESLAEIRGWLESGARQEVERGLPRVEEQLRRSTLDALLMRGELEVDRLQEVLHAVEARHDWLLERCRSVLVEEDARPEKDRARALRNVLRLGVSLDVIVQPVLWSAYELLCTLATSPEEQLDLFSEIGERLWSDTWARALDEGLSPDDLGVGEEAERQLSLLDELELGALDSLQEKIGARILALAGEPGRPSPKLCALFARRRGEAILRRALLDLAPAGGDRALRALGLWLRETGDLDPRLLRAFVSTLEGQGWVAEAFLALIATQRRSATVEGPDSHRLLRTLTLKVIAKEARLGVCSPGLLAVPEVDRAWSGHDAGPALALLGAGWRARTEYRLGRGLFTLHQRQSTTHPELKRWLEFERDPGWELETFSRVEGLIREMELGIDEIRAHHDWKNAGQKYQDGFRAWWRARLAQMQADRRPPGEVEVELRRADPDVVAGEVQRHWRQQNVILKNPEGSAWKNLKGGFDEVKRRAQALNRLRESAPDRSLNDLVEIARVHARAQEALRSTLEGDGPELSLLREMFA